MGSLVQRRSPASNPQSRNELNASADHCRGGTRRALREGHEGSPVVGGHGVVASRCRHRECRGSGAGARRWSRRRARSLVQQARSRPAACRRRWRQPGERPAAGHHPHAGRRQPARLRSLRQADRQGQGRRRVRAVAGRGRAGGGRRQGPREAGAMPDVEGISVDAPVRAHQSATDPCSTWVTGWGTACGDTTLAVRDRARRDGLPQHQLGRLGHRRRGDRLRRRAERRPPHHRLLRLPHRHRACRPTRPTATATARTSPA